MKDNVKRISFTIVINFGDLYEGISCFLNRYKGTTMPFTRIILLLMLGTLAIDAQNVGASCRTPDGAQGSCVSIKNCPPLKTLLVQIASKLAPFSELRKYICHLGKEPYVCCLQDSPPPSPPNPFPPPTLSSPIPPPRGPKECGFQGLVDRIIAGDPAPLGAWPWMVILRGKVGNRRAWHCGGTLINDRYVLTAAHCLDEESSGIELEFARIGEHTLKDNLDCNQFGRCAPAHQDIAVERIIIHPSYNKPCIACNDIALLRLARPVTRNRYVQPICLPVNPESDMGYPVEEFQGKAAWAAGWGTVTQDPRNPVRPDILQQVQLPIGDLPFCIQMKKSYPDQSMVICAGGKTKDTCRGDSGGPLTLTSNGGSVYFLVGVTSRGPRFCGAENTQGLYTSVHHYLPWILSNLLP